MVYQLVSAFTAAILCLHSASNPWCVTFQPKVKNIAISLSVSYIYSKFSPTYHASLDILEPFQTLQYVGFFTPTQTLYSYQGQQCSTVRSFSLVYFCSWGLGGQWLACPECRRSQHVNARGRLLWRVPCGGSWMHRGCWAADNRTRTPFHGSEWWATAAYWSSWKSCLRRWSLRAEKFHLLIPINTIESNNLIMRYKVGHDGAVNTNSSNTMPEWQN